MSKKVNQMQKKSQILVIYSKFLQNLSKNLSFEGPHFLGDATIYHIRRQLLITASFLIHQKVINTSDNQQYDHEKQQKKSVFFNKIGRLNVKKRDTVLS